MSIHLDSYKNWRKFQLYSIFAWIVFLFVNLNWNGVFNFNLFKNFTILCSSNTWKINKSITMGWNEIWDLKTIFLSSKYYVYNYVSNNMQYRGRFLLSSIIILFIYYLFTWKNLFISETRLLCHNLGPSKLPL